MRNALLHDDDAAMGIGVGIKANKSVEIRRLFERTFAFPLGFLDGKGLSPKCWTPRVDKSECVAVAAPMLAPLAVLANSLAAGNAQQREDSDAQERVFEALVHRKRLAMPNDWITHKSVGFYRSPL